MGVFSILNIPYSSEISIALMVIPVYLILRAVSEVIKFIYQRKDVQSFTYQVEISLMSNVIKARGFVDTGNGLYDRDSPVIVCGKKFFKKLVGNNVVKLKLKKIKISTVLKNGESFAVKLDYIKIYIIDKPNIYNNVTLAVVSKGIGEGYDVILHPALLGREQDEFNEKIEKVS